MSSSRELKKTAPASGFSMDAFLPCLIRWNLSRCNSKQKFSASAPRSGGARDGRLDCWQTVSHNGVCRRCLPTASAVLALAETNVAGSMLAERVLMVRGAPGWNHALTRYSSR